jgi:integrase
MHHLRHTAATFILSAGGNPATASQILGHSEKSTTLRIYAHVLAGDAIRAVDAIDTYLVAPGSKKKGTRSR